ncbi:MAG: hypothetical protein QM766_25395 [Burkholderiaceae bacterium]
MHPIPRLSSARRHRGQALVLALVLLFAGSLGLMFMFSAGQVSATKQRVVNAADAAAYSAAVWRARTMNYHAYSNRAIIVQEVAIAQAVTLVSWVKYFETFVDNVTTVVEVILPALAPAIEAIQTVIGWIRELTEWTATLEIWLRGADTVGYKNLLAESQQLMYLAGSSWGVSAVANQVARANDNAFFGHVLTDDSAYAQLTRRYESDDDRRRLLGLVVDSLDPFVTDRRADLPLPLPSSCFGSSWQQWVQWIRKRGGTAMAPDLERWEAADTLSIHDWRRRGGRCRQHEMIAIGWGAAEASMQNTGEIESNPGDVEDNESALEEAEDDIISIGGYNGISRVRDLNYESLDNPRFPTSRIAVIVHAPGSAARTGSTVGVGTGRLQLSEDLHNRYISALAVADVYFRRPADAPARVEYASLYSPYWQARLREPTEAERREAEDHVDR